MAAAGAASTALPTGQASLDNDDSNVSSPLSDVEDGDGDDASLDGLHLTRSSPPPRPGDDSDSDSNLSEANDTEAETERLFDTPQAQRQRDVVVGQYNDNQIYESTPSKLKKTYSMDDEGADGDNDSLSDNDDISMASSRGDDDAPSPIKATKSTELSSLDDTQDSIDNKKRKRSPAAEQSDAEQPLRKRTGSVAAPKEAASGQATPRVDDDDDDDILSTHPNSAEHSGPEDLGADIPVPEPLRESASPVKDAHVPKKLTRNGSKHRSDDGDETGDQDGDTHEEATADEEVDHQVDEEPAEPEDDAEAAARNAEEREYIDYRKQNRTDRPQVERKQAALEEWNELEAKFGLFRDRLYKDRLEKLETEEQSLQADPPTHSEYLLMKSCLDERLEKKLTEINNEHELTLEALDRVAIARRSQIWGQFYQGIREKREQFLARLNSEWYDTQNARRSAHSVPDYGVQFPTNPAQRTRNAVAYNTEVSFLSGLAKHEGFPAVPAMRGASLAEMDEDFAAFKRDARPAAQQRPVAQAMDDYQPVTYGGGGLGPAGEQFIKNTPWANPNHAAHKLQPVPLQSDSGPSGAMPPAKAATGSSRANGQSMPKHSPTMADASPETLRTATMLSQGALQRKRNGSLVGRGSKAAQEAPKAESAVAVS